MKLFKPADLKRHLGVNVNYIGTRRLMGFIRPAIAAKTAGSVHQYDAINAIKLAIDQRLESAAGIEMREACSLATDIFYGHIISLIVEDKKQRYLFKVGASIIAIHESDSDMPPAVAELQPHVQEKIKETGVFTVFSASRIVEDAKEKLGITDDDLIEASKLQEMPRTLMALVEEIKQSGEDQTDPGEDQTDPGVVLKDFFELLQAIESAEIEQNMSKMK